MPNAVGLVLYVAGILLIIGSMQILNLIITKYFENKEFKKYFRLFTVLMTIFILFRIYIFFYTNYLTSLNLSEEILTNKLLLMRMFSHIPFAIAVTLLLSSCYGLLFEMRKK